MEACAAVMAASATVFRTVFLQHRRASSSGDGAGGGDDAPPPPPSPEGERFEVLRTLRTRTPSEEEKDKEGGMEVREWGSRGSEG